jgi:hypothetical protein
MKFEITSGKIRVTDPCYTKDIWCAGVLENCLNGMWEASKVLYGNAITNGWGERVGELKICHEQYLGSECYEKTDIDVGVDSGQAGFFDDEKYPDGETGEYGSMDTFYGKVCAGTSGTPREYKEKMYSDENIKILEELFSNNTELDKDEVKKIIDTMKSAMVTRETHEYLGIANVGFGVATSSGYGDGGYSCYVKRDINGMIVAAKIVFIDLNEEEC